MKTVRGRYNGRVVVLEEHAPIDQDAEVWVAFPEPGEEGPFEWGHPVGTFGLPPIPSQEEWQIRVKRLEEMLNQWAEEDAEAPEDDWEQFKQALEQNRRDSGCYRSLFGDRDQEKGAGE